LLPFILPLAILQDLLIAMRAEQGDRQFGFDEHQGIEWRFMGETFYAGSMINIQLIQGNEFFWVYPWIVA
jgi:hypothetical protein